MIFDKVFLSGSPGNGRNIKVVATATPGTLIHTAIASTTQMDELWLWAINTDTVNRKLTIEFGGVTVPDDLIELLLTPGKDGAVLVVPGWVLNNSLVVRAFADVANVVNINGFVHRGTP